MVSAEYAAGFFDGEGSISLVAKRRDSGHPAWMLCVSVSQMDRRPLLALQETFGGTVRGPRRNSQYEWRLSSRAAEPFLRAIQPHAIVKADVVALALEFRDGVKPWGGRHLLGEHETARRQGLRSAIQECNRRYSRTRCPAIDINAVA